MEHAKVSWSQTGHPFSNTFQDKYYCDEDGLDESIHTFLKGNDLSERWQSCDGELFVIGELGFGTGLNFLITLKTFRDSAPKNLKLIYSSIEKFPLTKQELEVSLSNWPTLQKESKEFLLLYPDEIQTGMLEVDFDRVKLRIYFEDVVSALDHFEEKCDAWYLDGFAPSLNPEMWTEEIFKKMYEKSNCHATFSTFTVAGVVKRGLKKAGFQIEKAKGFGKKREMLKGRLL